MTMDTNRRIYIYYIIYKYMDVLDPMDIGCSLAKVANCNITIFKFGKS